MKRIDAARLKQALEESGTSQAALARELDVTRGLISHWINGHKDCPTKYLDQISTLLRVDGGWLLNRSSSEEDGHAEGQTFDILTAPEWIFRLAPADGGRDYGSSNVWTIPADLDTLVREVGQNSLDNPARHGGTVHMRFRIVELTEESSQRREFLDAIGFNELKQHIQGATRTKSRLATRLRSGLSRLAEREPLLLLRIDDYGTTGLFGSEVPEDEAQGQSPFAALVRNNLDSAKQNVTAGGSYGLGKAVLWRCSDLSTVLFASRIMPEHVPDGRERAYRFIGKSELTWHRQDRDYAGPGWYGSRSEQDQNARADSTWLPDGALATIQMERNSLPKGVDPSRAWGTSILILGFRDPDSEEVPEGARLLAKLEKAVAHSFWPAIMRQHLTVSLERMVDGELKQEKSVDPTDLVPELCAALRDYDLGQLVSELEEPGDVVRISVPHEIPATEEQAEMSGLLPFEGMDVQSDLIVRLAEADIVDEDHINCVALVRGREMVVKYWPRKNIVVGGAPFYSVFLAGTAIGGDNRLVATEQFLRLNEPPAHDDWAFNEEVKELYALGAGSRLKEMFAELTERLKHAVKPKGKPKDEGPPLLKKLLQIIPGPQPNPKAGSLRNIKSELENGAYSVEADIRINDRSRAWQFHPRLRINAESGRKPQVGWAKLDIVDHTGGAVETTGDLIWTGPKTKRLRFRALSEANADGVDVARCRVRLDLQAQPAKERT